MEQTLREESRIVAGYRINETEYQRLQNAKNQLGLKSISETMRLFIKRGIDETLEVSK